MEAEDKQELMNLATSHYNAGNYEVALETYKKALTIDPSYLKAKHGLARSLASLHRCKVALEEFDWVLRNDGLSNAWYSELYKQRGDVYFEMQMSGHLHGKAMLYDDVLQNFLKALDDYDRALVLNPKNEAAARMKAQVNKDYLQQREKLGINDEMFGYIPYYEELEEASLQSRTNDSNEYLNKDAFSKTKEQWLQEGINHYNTEDYTNSLRACERAIQLEANYARAYYGKGLTLRRVGNDQEALKAFAQAIRLDLSYMKAYFGMGNIFFKMHRYEEALAVYNYAIRLNPTHAAAYSGKGACLFALQRKKEALAAYDKAIELDPSCFDRYYQKALKLLDLKREKDAFAVFDQAILFHPYDFSVYESIAELVAYLGHCEKGLAMCEKGLAIYDQAIHLNLKSAAAYVRKGDIFQLYLKRNDDAVAAYDQAALLDPEFTTNKASLLLEIDRYEEAANAYDQILKLPPNDAVAHFMKGVSHLFADRNEEALASFEQVIQLDPDDVITHSKKGKALFGCGRYEEALATFKKTISLFYDRYILSKYDKARHFDESQSIDEIYADINKLFSGLEGFQDALADLEQCYKDICKKIDEKIQAMYGWMKYDEDEYGDEFTYLEISRNPHSDRDDGEIEEEFELGHDGEWHFYDDPDYDIPVIWD